MAALTAPNLNSFRMSRDEEKTRLRHHAVEDAFTAHLGAFLYSDPLTAEADISAAAGDIPLGLAVDAGNGTTDAGGGRPQSILGDDSATPEVPQVVIEEGQFELRDVAVAGASTVAHIDKYVYLAVGTDNLADLTLTAATGQYPLGRTTKIRGALFDVVMFDRFERLAHPTAP